jgi:hypothetical protein
MPGKEILSEKGSERTESDKPVKVLSFSFGSDYRLSKAEYLLRHPEPSQPGPAPCK